MKGLRIIDPQGTTKHDFNGVIIEYKNFTLREFAAIQDKFKESFETAKKEGSEELSNVESAEKTLKSLTDIFNKLVAGWENVKCARRGEMKFEDYKDRLDEVFDLTSINEIIFTGMQIVNGLGAEEEGN